MNKKLDTVTKTALLTCAQLDNNLRQNHARPGCQPLLAVLKTATANLEAGEETPRTAIKSLYHTLCSFRLVDQFRFTASEEALLARLKRLGTGQSLH